MLQADPLCRVTGPRMNPSVDVGRPPRPFRHLRMAQHRTPDPSSSRAPVHSALVQISVTRHHQPRRPAFIVDARGNTGGLAIAPAQIVGRSLASKVTAPQHSALAIVAAPLHAIPARDVPPKPDALERQNRRPKSSLNHYIPTAATSDPTSSWATSCSAATPAAARRAARPPCVPG